MGLPNANKRRAAHSVVPNRAKYPRHPNLWYSTRGAAFSFSSCRRSFMVLSLSCRASACSSGVNSDCAFQRTSVRTSLPATGAGSFPDARTVPLRLGWHAAHRANRIAAGPVAMIKRTGLCRAVDRFAPHSGQQGPASVYLCQVECSSGHSMPEQRSRARLSRSSTSCFSVPVARGRRRFQFDGRTVFVLDADAAPLRSL